MRRIFFPVGLSGLIFLIACFFSVAWGAEMSAIDQAHFNQKKQILSLYSTRPLDPDMQYLEKGDQHKIVIDLPEAVFQPTHQNIRPSHQDIDEIKISQFSSVPPQVRIVWSLQNPVQLAIRSQKSGKGYLTFIQTQNSQNKVKDLISPPPVRVASDIQLAQNLKQLTQLNILNHNLVLEGTQPIVPEIRKLKHSKKYILTLYQFKSALRTLPLLKSNFIGNVRLSQTGKDIEISFDVLKDAIEVVPYSQGNTCTIQFIPVAQKQDLVQIQNIDVYEMSPTVSRIRIFADKGFDYQVYPLENPHRLVVDSIGTKMPDFASRKMDSTLLKSVRLSPVHSDSASDVRMVFDLKEEVKYQYDFKRGNNYLEIILRSRKNPAIFLKNYNALIVIDPGHGGNDPGAIGQRGTHEKKVALNVSKYLKRYLMNDRHKVLLTRSEDLEVLLQPRVDVANLRNADLFVSIHLNSMPPGNTHVHGIETYYTTSQSLGLAKTLHSYMVNELGVKNRGVRKRGLYVTRKTKMPSVLLEIGFLSNPSEETALSRTQYQRRVAKAIRDGIEDYLSKHPPKRQGRH